MKKILIVKMIFSLSAFLLSCEALPVNYSKSQSWLIPENAHKKNRTTLTLLAVHVDRTGGWDSIERETAALAPLYFWNHGCRVVTAGERPEYAAEIQVREREFNRGWRTKRSLAVEVRIWPYEDAPAGGAPLHDQKLPAAVGRVIAMGDKSFSSSETMGRLLSKAIGKAANQMIAHHRYKKDA